MATSVLSHGANSCPLPEHTVPRGQPKAFLHMGISPHQLLPVPPATRLCAADDQELNYEAQELLSGYHTLCRNVMTVV